jgi:hypothetical protein
MQAPSKFYLESIDGEYAMLSPRNTCCPLYDVLIKYIILHVVDSMQPCWCAQDIMLITSSICVNPS